MPAPLIRIFDHDTPHSPDLSAFARYTDMLARFENALSSGEAYTAIWKRIILSLRPLPAASQISAVNELMNKRPYVSDAQRWGANDYWAAPGEFLKYGGDCEDFCIAKYLALRDLGHAEEAMRITIVNDLQLGIPHAILLIKSGDMTLVLDNQAPLVRKVSDIHRYSPVYSINRLGWWYHAKR